MSEHPDYRKRLATDVQPGAPALLSEEENAHGQYAAIRGLPVYAPEAEFAREYRRRALTLYGDWHSWW